MRWQVNLGFNWLVPLDAGFEMYWQQRTERETLNSTSIILLIKWRAKRVTTISFSGCCINHPGSPKPAEKPFISKSSAGVKQLLFKSRQLCHFMPHTHVYYHLCRQKTTGKKDIRTASGNKRESPNHNDLTEKEVWSSFTSTHMTSRHRHSLPGGTE